MKVHSSRAAPRDFIDQAISVIDDQSRRLMYLSELSRGQWISDFTA